MVFFTNINGRDLEVSYIDSHYFTWKRNSVTKFEKHKISKKIILYRTHIVRESCTKTFRVVLVCRGHATRSPMHMTKFRAKSAKCILYTSCSGMKSATQNSSGI
jgi:hypothetical protein